MDNWISRLLEVSSDLVDITAQVATGEVAQTDVTEPLNKVIADLQGIVRDVDELDPTASPAQLCAEAIRYFNDLLDLQGIVREVSSPVPPKVN